LYSGLYLVVALIFTMGRRVIPFFIEKGVDEQVDLVNRRWLDLSSLVLFLSFWIAELIEPNGLVVALLAIALFVLHGMRLLGWHTRGIWKKPLLWVIYIAYGFLVAGLALKAAVYFLGISPFLAAHAFAYGGVGIMTIGMMARVALGHTGRDVFSPPPVLWWMFAIIIVGAVIRVFFPLFDSSQYTLWIGISQVLWTISFAMFLFIYTPVCMKPRIDGRYG
ncbi:MAG: NnrS family protein, partial [Gammaproteobacteria bacterium]|nr:NnrS family protein [Gammaproteobacteria bacterium]